MMFCNQLLLPVISVLAFTSTAYGKENSVRGLNPVVQGEYSDADEYPCVPGGFISNAGSGAPLTSVARKGTRTRAYKPSPPPSISGTGMVAEEVFQSYREGIDQGDGKNEFTYLYDQCVESYEYDIVLGFAELDPTMCEEGLRVFDITVNGVYMERGFDVIAAAGECNKAVFLSQRFSAAGGELYLRFAYNNRSTTNRGPIVNFISITPIAAASNRRQLKICKNHENHMKHHNQRD